MSTATAGRAREYRVRDHLLKHGWRFVMRAAGSKGSADLLMASDVHGALLVQVKKGADVVLGPADRRRFVRDAQLVGALAVYATCGPGVPVTFYEVTEDKPSKWQRWSPA